MVKLATTEDVLNPKRKGYDFRINQFLFRAAIGPGLQMNIASSDVGTGGQSIDVRQNPEDFTSNIGRIFSRNNFTGGSNLDLAHKRTGSESDINKFWDSKNIDVFSADRGSSYFTSLLRETNNMRTLSSSDGDNYVARVGTTIYTSDDAILYKSTDGGTTWSTQAIGISSGYQIKGLATHGTLLYIIANNGSAGEIIKWDGSSATQVDTDKIFSGIWSAKGLMFVTWIESNIAYIQQYDGGSGTTFATGSSAVTLPQGETFTDVIDAGAVVLVSATNGVIYSLKDVSSTFTSKGETEITGESITCLSENQGLIFYGTKESQTGSKALGRLYTAQITVADDLYVLGNHQLIKEWDIASVDASPTVLFNTRDSVYMGIHETSTQSYLWRYYLPTGGIARYHELVASAADKIVGINYINERFIVSMTGVGVYQEKETYSNDGYLITAAADFYTAEKKQWVEAQIEHETIDSGNEISIHFTDTFEAINNEDDSNWSLVFTSISGAGLKAGQLNSVSRYGGAKVVLKSGDLTTSPKLQSLQLRALARPELVVVQVPVNMSDRVERPYRKPITVKSLGESIYQTMKLLEGTSVTLELFDPAEVIEGVVESIQYPIISNPDVGSVTNYAILTVRGTRQDTFTALTSGDAFAGKTFAKMIFGGR